MDKEVRLALVALSFRLSAVEKQIDELGAKPRDKSSIVGLRFWAEAYGTTTETISKLVRRGRRGRGWDARILPPLDVPGHARWKRADAEAHVASLKNEAP